ncbi:MAG: TIGR00730 family Rossman fold protein [Prevotella sp.]|uniref:LOG family protein n=1 Tax=Prevotella sp. TaxID=59823 RepID=UPI002A27E0D0|nr:TIGR00730 family Rossman fold protein [Prevotella sp.]MDD7318434.1 TIGR00730 family Rossman fold protein [Prevotellaceae bacterium]MDY4020215.1 TIGR00730 family Rossman fold protein [Prevotella sp.]
MNIGIFCSANDNIDKAYFDMTRELGEWIGKNGHGVVFGGCDMGLMEHMAQACHDAGGRNIGVIPSIIEKNGHVSRYVDVAIHCDNLSDRKDLLLANSDVIVALPGGIGTLDEVFTVAAGATIGYHCKQVILYNMNGFWDKLIECLDDLQQKGMIRGNYGRQIKTVGTLKELVAALG